MIGDRERLRQIVDNLLANVRTHTPAATPVSVAVRRDNGAARISVTDSGPGLDPEQLAHVFERFYRADASRARASGGVGLGPLDRRGDRRGTRRDGHGYLRAGRGRDLHDRAAAGGRNAHAPHIELTAVSKASALPWRHGENSEPRRTCETTTQEVPADRGTVVRPLFAVAVSTASAHGGRGGPLRGASASALVTQAAKELGVTRAKLKDAIVDAAAARIDEAVSDGDVDKDDAADLKADVADNLNVAMSISRTRTVASNLGVTTAQAQRRLP